MMRSTVLLAAIQAGFACHPCWEWCDESKSAYELAAWIGGYSCTPQCPQLFCPQEVRSGMRCAHNMPACVDLPPYPPSPPPPPPAEWEGGVNVLETTGPYGDATTFPWTASCSYSGQEAKIAKAASRTNNADYYQQNCNSQQMWVQVELPSAAYCGAAAIYGWPHAHQPNTNAYIAASNDGVTWDEVAVWNVHAGHPEPNYWSQAFLKANSYPSSLNGLAEDKFIMLENGGTPYRFWRVGGKSGFNNGYLIVQRWALMCASSGSVYGDPHLSLPHGGKADFKGDDKSIYNFLSAKNLAVNVMTEHADFELYAKDHPRHKDVHGSFLTQAHVVARTSTGKMVRVSFWASKIGINNIGWANGTIDNEPAFSLAPHKSKNSKVVDDVSLQMDYSSLHVFNPEFEIIVTPKGFCADSWCGMRERNVTNGLHHRLDVQIKARVSEAEFAVAPHGIIGQAWDGDGKAIDGELDKFPESGEFTTYAQAKGAIEGNPSDYKVASKHATDFKFSRFDATSAAPRNVAKLVAAGELNAPKELKTGPTPFVGSTEITEADLP